MSSSAVNVPVNPKQKEKDIAAKLQLYGIYSAFANGKAPSNKQIDVAMNTALAWRGLNTPDKRLSAEGRELVADLKDVIQKAKILFLTKNQGNLLQDFIWQSQQIGSGNATTPNAPVDKETAKQHGQEALEGFRTLGTLLITNGQFRKLLSDASVIFRDIAGDAAQKAANKVNPSEEQLANVDKPAPDNTWHEKPDLSTGGIRSQISDATSIAKSQAKDVAGKATSAADPHGSSDPRSAANRADNLDPNAGANVAANEAQNKVDENLTEDQKEQARQKKEQVKETAREYRDRTNAYFKDKFPEERRDQIIYRLKKMVVEIQGHEDYSQAIDTLLGLAEQYTGHAKNLTEQSTDAVKGAHTQSSLQLAEADLKTLLERFANSTSFDDLVDSIDQIYRDADNDPELKNWFRDIDTFVRRCLKEQGYILTDDSDRQWDKLYDHGNFLLRERYRSHTDRIGDELKFLGDQFDSDPENKAFARSMDKLFNDLGNDENGKPTFKPHLVTDLTDVLIPAFFENIRYVPIPRIEYSDPMIDAVVENIVLEGDNLAPNVFEFGSDNYFRWGRKSIKNKNKNKVMLAVSGVQCDLRDVAYYIKKKEGFPSITDKGVVDIFLGGTGFSFKVAMETADATDRQHFFKIGKIDVDIKHMNIKVKKSNHKLLFSLFKPLALAVMRPVVTKVVEVQIRKSVTDLDAFLYDIKKQVDADMEDLKRNPDPDKASNIYQRYYNAIQRKITEGKRKTAEASKDKTVNVAVTQQDSIFKNIALPGGISTEATKYKELAAKGDKWESPVFSIGSAAETTSLPKAPEVTRKPHSTANATLQPKGGINTQSQGYSTGIPGTAAPSGLNTQSQGYSTGTSGIAGTTGMNTQSQGYSTGTTGTAGTTGYPTSIPSYSNSGPTYTTSTPGFSNQPNGY